jgi:hypothetical protein
MHSRVGTAFSMADHVYIRNLFFLRIDHWRMVGWNGRLVLELWDTLRPQHGPWIW